MNCTCIDTIEKKLVGMEYGNRKRKVTNARLVSVGFLFGENKLVTVTNSEFELEVEGYTKPRKQMVLHSYCPFCGAKIEKDE